jgi:hypothetical protein
MPGVRMGAGPPTGQYYVSLMGARGMSPDGWHWGMLAGRVPETVKIKGPLVPGQRVQFKRMHGNTATQWAVFRSNKRMPQHGLPGATGMPGPGMVGFDAYSMHPGVRVIVPPVPIPNPRFRPSRHSNPRNPLWVYEGQFMDTGGDYGGVADVAVGLNSSQRANAQIIEREFTAAGFGPPVVAAAIINALAESGLRNDAVGDAGASIGLFQLHERGGGKGMSSSERMDPTRNARRIIEEAKRASGFMNLVRAGETSIPKLAAAFSTYVERPADKPGNEVKRAAMVARYFPGQIAAQVAHTTRSAPWWVWTILVSGVVGGLALVWAIEKKVENRKR